MAGKKVNIGLLGLGNVGIGTFKALEMNREAIAASTSVDFQITRILVRNLDKDRGIEVPKNCLTQNPEDIINDPEIDVVVELLGGIDPASEYMLSAMKKGKHVVTANKAAVAANYDALMQAASDNKVMFRFEASVAGGIPILSSLTGPLLSNQLDSVLGILNGTTNYILTQMSEYGMAYSDVLKDAQKKGFAEADPTADVEGIDAANKLSIIMSLIFGVRIAPEDIPTEGITSITKDDIEFADEFGYKIKLLAAAKKHGKQIEGHVQPAMVHKAHPLASVSNEFNAVFVKGNAVDDLMFYGKGAGPLPTGSAVLGDIIEIGRAAAKGTAFDLKSGQVEGSAYEFTGDGENMYYLNLIAEDIPGVLGKISTVFGNTGISIQSVVQRPAPGLQGSLVPLVFIVHETTRTKLDQALIEIKKNNYVKDIKNVIRVEPM